jgi:general stress protein YciG
MDEKQDRGFRRMLPEKRREVSSAGGKAAHEKGTAHKWTIDTAKEAGRKGGLAAQAKKREAKLFDAKINEGFDAT